MKKNRKNKLEAKLLKKYGTGGDVTSDEDSNGFDWAGLAQQAPGIINGVMNMLGNDPRAKSKQPLVNSTAMRTMTTPYGFGTDDDGVEDPNKPKKKASPLAKLGPVPANNPDVFNTQEELNAGNSLAQNFAARHPNYATAVSPNQTYVGRDIGDPKPKFIYEDGVPPVNKPKPVTVPDYIDAGDIQQLNGSYWYEDKDGHNIDVDPSVVNLPRFRAAQQRVVAAKAAGTPESQLPKFAFGGEAYDSDELDQLKQMAEENGMTLQELIQGMQESKPKDQEGDNDEDNTDDPDGDEDDEEEFGYGGQAGKVPINVEGGEVMETPDGQVNKVRGPKHESGGVNVAVPKGTKIFSDRLKIGGKTMQERKLSRERLMNRLNKTLESNPTDNLVKQTINRTAQNHQAEEGEDMKVQKLLNDAANGKYGYGTGEYGIDPNEDPGIDWRTLNNRLNMSGPLDYTPAISAQTPSITPKDYVPGFSLPAKEKEDVDYNGRLTTGDMVGLAGNAFNAIAPIVNTMANKRATTPNINRFRGFGHDALADNDAAQNVLATTRANKISDVNTSANTAYASNNNSSNSVNTKRALDIATRLGVDRSKAAADDSYAGNMVGVLGQRSSIDLSKDRMEMMGEQQKDLANKQDTDNYYSNLADNLTNFGNNVQGIGRSFNQHQSNTDNEELLGLLSENGIKIGRGKDGKLKLMNT